MKSRGFTLVELLLYVTIVAIMIISISGLLSLLMQSRVKNQTVAEVEGQGVQIMQIATQTIRNATAINSPTIGTNGSSLSLNVTTPANSPTVFDLSGGTLRITEGANPATPLTNSQIVVSSLSFQNLSLAGTHGTVRIQFTLSYINASGRNEYDFNKTFYGTATLR